MHAPPPIRTDSSNAFANNTMRVRLPAIIDETLALNGDYPASIQSRLRELRESIASGAVVQPLNAASADDYASWLKALQDQQARYGSRLTWHNAEWFFAETYAYRCLVDASRYHENGRDPFAPKKADELKGATLWSLLQQALRPTADRESRLMSAFAFALWGNRIDLSYTASLERGTAIAADDLLVDDREPLLDYLLESAPLDTVTIVADNTGSELAMDLALADCLLDGIARRVVVYLKAHPTFVSDAVVADVWALLRTMSLRPETERLASRLVNAWETMRLRFLPHAYWNSSLFLRQTPPELRQALNRANLLIIKGDANYRRAVGDCIWPAETPFAHVMSYMAAPTLCLRTLKSDPVVGLPSADKARQLDRDDPQWRVNGKRGLIQFKPART